MSIRGGHKKSVKKSFLYQLMHELMKHRIKNRIPISKISASTNLSERRIRQSGYTGNITWFDAAKLLYYYDKWFKITLIDASKYNPSEYELEDEETLEDTE